MSSLYRVMLPNPYFKVGDYVEANDGDVQKVRMQQVKGRLVPGGYEGLVIPLALVRKYLMKLLARGFDDQGAFAELQGRFRESPQTGNKFWENYCEAVGEDPAKGA